MKNLNTFTARLKGILSGTFLAFFVMVFFLSFPSHVKAQAPNLMSYQAIVRDASDNLVTNSAVGLRVTIRQGSPAGSIVYQETNVPITNDNGLFSTQIGSGTVVSGSIGGIDWSNGPYFLETEIDPAGGTAYSITANSQLLSVPYALYAETSGGGGAGQWNLVGNDIFNANTGNVVIGEFVQPSGKFVVGDTGTFRMLLGHAGNFNEAESGRLVFTEDVNFPGTCGFEFWHSGADNTLSIVSGCTTLGDTSIVFTRTGEVRIPERLKIGENTNPGADLHIVQSSAGTTPSAAGIRLAHPVLPVQNQIWTDGNNLNIAYNGTRIAYIDNTGAYVQVSDRSVKNNISTVGTVMDKLKQLVPVSYYYNHVESDNRSVGFIAQDVDKLFPDLVSKSADGMLAIQYDEVGVLAIKAIQEQQDQIDQQKELIEIQQAQIEELKEQLEVLMGRANSNNAIEK